MRGVQLSAAIISIVVGAIGTIFGLLIAIGGGLVADIGFGGIGAVIVIIGVLKMGVNVGAIVLGGMFCINKRQMGVGIALLVMNVISMIFWILMFSVFSIFPMLANIACIALIITYLVMLGQKPQAQPQVQPQQVEA